MVAHISLGLLVLSITLVSAISNINSFSAKNQFAEFQRTYNKAYATDAETNHRYSVFKQNLNKINGLNQQSSSAKFAVNEHADLTETEFANLYLSKYPVVRDPSVPVAADLPKSVIDATPSSFDWREKGAVTEVKNQGQCGSCWSFSTTGNVEGQWFLAGNKLTSLSEQNLVDCSHECMEYENQNSCNAGCGGGLQPNAYQYIIKNGIDTEASYPYTAKDGTCVFNKDNVGAHISNWTMIPQDETQIAAYLAQNGPLAIAADATEWQFYFGGVFDVPCGKTLDHGILIVGYGNQTNIFGKNVDYWIVKNSWGAHWGEQGYLKIVRGSGKCGLNTFVSSSIVTKK